MVSTWQGPPAMKSLFTRMFCCKSCPNIVKTNNFINFQSYFLQKVQQTNTFMVYLTLATQGSGIALDQGFFKKKKIVLPGGDPNTSEKESVDPTTDIRFRKKKVKVNNSKNQSMRNMMPQVHALVF